jgi:uncharacterized phage protein (TIGR01671 family)
MNNRQIKFRAWDKEKKRMGTVIYVMPSDDGKARVGVNFWNKNGIDHISDKQGEGFELMQFTGLTDKNGKEIYENDIVRVIKLGKTNKTDYIGVVGWCNMNSCFAFNVDDDKKYNWILGSLSEMKYEVIGNVLENPEFLGEDKGI